LAGGGSLCRLFSGAWIGFKMELSGLQASSAKETPMKKFLMLLTLAGLMVPATFGADTKKDQPPATGQEQPKKEKKTKKKKSKKNTENKDTAPTGK
jgi:hypothetical protein